MARRTVLLLYAVTLCLGLTSCERLKPEEAAIRASRQLKIEPLKVLDAIPAEYGNLVGVTSNSSKPDWAQLWFEKPDKEIIVVWVNFVEGGLRSEAVVIPRK